jgi:hypothetical protein
MSGLKPYLSTASIVSLSMSCFVRPPPLLALVVATTGLVSAATACYDYDVFTINVQRSVSKYCVRAFAQ